MKLKIFLQVTNEKQRKNNNLNYFFEFQKFILFKKIFDLKYNNYFNFFKTFKIY